MAKTVVEWCEAYAAQDFPGGKDGMFRNLADLLSPSCGPKVSSLGVLLVKSHILAPSQPTAASKSKTTSKRRVLRLEFRYGAEASRIAKRLGGRFVPKAKVWDIPDADGAARASVLDALKPVFSHVVDPTTGVVEVLGGERAPCAASSHGLLPERRWVDNRAVVQALKDRGFAPRRHPEIYRALEDWRYGFRRLETVPGGFLTRHTQVLLRAGQNDSSVLCLAWDVASRRILELAYGKAAMPLMGRFAESIEALGEPVVSPWPSTPDVPVLLRLGEAWMDDVHGVPIRLVDSRSLDGAAAKFDGACCPVRIDGGELERLWGTEGIAATFRERILAAARDAGAFPARAPA